MKSKVKIFSLMLVMLLIFTSCDFSSLSENGMDTDKPDIQCEAHVDADDNGMCDVCDISLLVYIDFYTVNDLHGKFDDTSANIGIDELTSYLKAMSQKDEHFVFLSSGDMWQGSSESNLTKGQIMTEWMNHLGFSAMTLGNHEYDWGEEYIRINDGLAEFPFLAINVYDRDTNERVDYCDASVVIERGGIEIGIIGAIGDCYSSISGDKTEDIYFKTGADLTLLVKKEAERLRADGVDYIVYSIHDGYEENQYSEKEVSASEIGYYYNSSLSDGYIDLVFEAHTHQRYTLIDEYGVYHLQGAGENKGISHVEIGYNTVNNSSKISSAEFVPSSVYDNYPDDEIVDKLLEKYSDDISMSHVVLGNNDRTRESYEIKSLVAELYYEMCIEKWENYDVVLGGGFISARSPYRINAGQVSYSDVQSVLPFDNQIVLCAVSGMDLKMKFLETTNKNYYVYLSDYGKDIRYDIDPDATYYIITDTYSSSYEYNNLTVIDCFYSDVYARDLVAMYIKQGGWSNNN